MPNTAVIKSVKDEIKQLPNNGPHVVAGSFEYSDWSYFTKSLQSAQQAQQQLKGFIDQEQEYEIEDKGREFMGRKQLTLRSWPGMQQQSRPAFAGRSGGGGSFQPRFRDTEQGTLLEGNRIHRSVALQESVALHSGSKIDDQTVYSILETAEKFYGFLVDPFTNGQSQQNQLPPPGTITNVPSKGSDHQSLNELKERFNLKSGNQVKSKAYGLYVTEIKRAENAARLSQLVKLASQSRDGGSITIEEENELHGLIQQRIEELQQQPAGF